MHRYPNATILAIQDSVTKICLFDNKKPYLINCLMVMSVWASNAVAYKNIIVTSANISKYSGNRNGALKIPAVTV